MTKFLSLLVALGPAASALGAPPGDGSEIRRLQLEIAVAKLDRTLNLTRDQARALLPPLQEVCALRSRLRAEQGEHRLELVKALTAVRDDLVRTGVVCEPSRKSLQSARGASMERDLRAAIHALLQKTEDVLNPNQKARLRRFDPRAIAPDGNTQVRTSDTLRKTVLAALSPQFTRLIEARAR